MIFAHASPSWCLAQERQKLSAKAWVRDGLVGLNPTFTPTKHPTLVGVNLTEKEGRGKRAEGRRMRSVVFAAISCILFLILHMAKGTLTTLVTRAIRAAMTA